jgi:hypothetical protein
MVEPLPGCNQKTEDGQIDIEKREWVANYPGVEI